MTEFQRSNNGQAGSSNAKLFLFAGPNWYLMNELERAMYLNENTKRIFEIGSKS